MFLGGHRRQLRFAPEVLGPDLGCISSVDELRKNKEEG
jgi:hypothetical protein